MNIDFKLPTFAYTDTAIDLRTHGNNNILPVEWPVSKNGEGIPLTSIYAEDIPHRAVTVYMYLRDRANKEGKCYPAISTIAKDLKLSRRTVKRAMADLEKTGHLSKGQRWRENGGRSSLMYTVRL